MDHAHSNVPQGDSSPEIINALEIVVFTDARAVHVL
jgi:hypothetical protein